MNYLQNCISKLRALHLLSMYTSLNNRRYIRKAKNNIQRERTRYTDTFATLSIMIFPSCSLPFILLIPLPQLAVQNFFSESLLAVQLPLVANRSSCLQSNCLWSQIAAYKLLMVATTRRRNIAYFQTDYRLFPLSEFRFYHVNFGIWYVHYRRDYRKD